MSVNLKQQLDRVAAKADLIVERCRQLVNERDALNDKIAKLEAMLADQEAENDKLRIDNEYLRVVSVLCPDRKEIEKARSLISGLVRDIDRCILDLKE